MRPKEADIFYREPTVAAGVSGVPSSGPASAGSLGKAQERLPHIGGEVSPEREERCEVGVGSACRSACSRVSGRDSLAGVGLAFGPSQS